MNDKVKDSGIFTEVKTEGGFILNVNLRRDTLEEAMTDLKAFIKANKLSPHERYQNKGFNKPQANTKPCPAHPAELLKEKTSKTDGKTFWSHSRGVYPNLTWCNGSGFDGELKQQVDQVFLKNEVQPEAPEEEQITADDIPF